MADGARVLVIGCGQLGTRHLEAVAALPGVREIEVVDPQPEALALGRARLTEAQGRPASTRVRWLSSIDEASRGGALCIVATWAEGRCRLVREVARRLGYQAFLVEKIVGQSVGELEALLDSCRQGGISVWVNLKTRAYPFHQRVKARLDPGEPILFSAIGGNHGLANNGIHTVDLFVFYDGCEQLTPAGARIDPVLHPSKRGRGLFDLSGTLQAGTERGSHFTLSYAGDHAGSEQIAIATRSYRCIVDHLTRWAVESSAETGWAWRPAPFDDEVLVSQMTRRFVGEILKTGRCELPTLAEALPAHRYLLSELTPHFSRLMERPVELCPIT